MFKEYQTEILTPDEAGLQRAAELIRQGLAGAFPTETVYGLGANAYDETAVARIFKAKGRPQDNPLIVHVDSRELADQVAEFTPLAEKLAAAFWPGPLTLVLPRRECIPDAVTAGLPTVGVRMPSHPVAHAFIAACGVPIAAPSANTSGKPSPATAEHVLDDLRYRIPFVIDGGPVEIGLESTVVDATGDFPVLLRPGKVSREQLAELCGQVLLPGAGAEQRPASPGMKYRHYAPQGRVHIGHNIGELEVLRLDLSMHRMRMPVLVLSNATADEMMRRGARPHEIYRLGDTKEEIAANWFTALRYCDKTGFMDIITEEFDDEGLGLALNNRARRAAAKE
ncbi:MAG: threonylcarbamoyl-AMP synthase [Firmicutes bacterium]|nr:threonylcarbamoyl-AMP synthase [Bacillota bacterium]